MIKKSLAVSLFVFLAALSLKATSAKSPTPPGRHGIIFDMDGTLVDSIDAKIVAWQEAFKPYISLTYAELATHSGGTGMRIKNSIEEKYKITIPDSVIPKMHVIYDTLHPKMVKPIDAAIKLVIFLHANKQKYNISLAVASAARKKEIIKSLQIAGIENCFDIIVSGQDDLQEYKSPYGTNKPQPCIYLEAARLLQIPSWNCIAFEDSRTGSESALQAGMHVFAIPTNSTKSQFNNTHYGHRITFLKSAIDFDIDRYLGSQTKMTLQKALEHWAIK